MYLHAVFFPKGGVVGSIKNPAKYGSNLFGLATATI